VPKEEALKVAHRMALETVLAKLGAEPTGPAKSQAEEAQKALDELKG
jgi:hypothetical protein